MTQLHVIGMHACARCVHAHTGFLYRAVVLLLISIIRYNYVITPVLGD